VYVEHELLLRHIAINNFSVPEDDAKALVHDIFITYLAHPAGVRGDVRAYLVGAICNACRNYRRSKLSERRVMASDESFAEPAAPEAEPQVIAAVRRTLERAVALGKLDAPCFEVLCRRYLHDEDTDTIAEALQTSRRNVHYRLHVCRKRARAAYESISRGKP
jgi:RNA polymerase sigma factor (sigma-70 family)